MTPPRRPGGNRIGIALSGDRIVARAAPSVLPGDLWEHPLTGSPDAEGRWAELEEAMRELRAALPASAVVVASVIVLPPLVRLRSIDLPPLRPDERRRALTRDASRWFVGAREPQVVDAVPSVTGVMAAALSARVAEAIVLAATAAGIRVRTIRAAPWGWAALVDRSQRDTTRVLLIPGEHGVDVVRLARALVVETRRVRPAPDMVEEIRTLLDADGATGGQAVVIGGGAIAQEIVTRLGLRGIARDDDAMTVAASMAARAHGPELLPDAARRAAKAAVARLTRVLIGVAALLMVAAAAVELWGADRRLTAVQLERAQVHAQVEHAIAARDSATALEAQFAVVATTTRDAPRWSAVLVEVARALPDDAHLVSLSAAGDSIVLVGEAARAADVFEALRRDPRVVGVRADAPIRREFTADRSQVERFSLIARLSPSGLTEMPSADATMGATAP